MTQLENLGIKTVILSTNADLLADLNSNYRKYIKDFNSHAHARGVFVHAMYLQSYLFIDQHGAAIDRTNKIINFNDSAIAPEKFDGLHLDVEPHTHPNWDSPNGYLPGSNTNETIMQNFIGLLDTIRKRLNESYLSGSDTLMLSADQTYWIHDKVVTGELNTGHVNDLLKYIDFITLFDYTDNESNLISFVDDEVYAASKAKSIVLALDTKYDVNYPNLTFYEEGWFAYNRGDKLLQQYFGEKESFLATCVFKYESTRDLYDNRYSNGLITSIEEDSFENDDPADSSPGEWTRIGTEITNSGIIDSIKAAHNGTRVVFVTAGLSSPTTTITLCYELGAAGQNPIQDWTLTPVLYYWSKTSVSNSAKVKFGFIENDGDHWRMKNGQGFSTVYNQNYINLLEENFENVDNSGGSDFSLKEIKYIEFFIEADASIGENTFYFDDIIVGKALETYPENVITSIELDKYNNNGPSAGTPGEWTRYGTILTNAGITKESGFVNSGVQAIFYGADWSFGTFGGLRYQLGTNGQESIQDWSTSTELFFFGMTNIGNDAKIAVEFIEEDGDRWRVNNDITLTTHYKQYSVGLDESNFTKVELNGDGIFNITKVKLLGFTFKKGNDIGKYKYYFDDFTRNKITKVGEKYSTPNSFKLFQNYPNPFNPTTMINYFICQPAHVKLTIVDLLGETIEVLVDTLQVSGKYQYEYNAAFLASGIYFYELRVGNTSQKLKMLLLK
ncbi:MAG: T9SS type A sorting domain-containing protein [Ignavibacteria bacterium]|nr:T9SS type A sorting domain-containing protein [Ignavibacteria bacterium]